MQSKVEQSEVVLHRLAAVICGQLPLDESEADRVLEYVAAIRAAAPPGRKDVKPASLSTQSAFGG